MGVGLVTLMGLISKVRLRQPRNWAEGGMTALWRILLQNSFRGYERKFSGPLDRLPLAPADMNKFSHGNADALLKLKAEGQ